MNHKLSSNQTWKQVHMQEAINERYEAWNYINKR